AEGTHAVVLSGTGTTTTTGPPGGGGGGGDTTVTLPSNAFTIGKLKKLSLAITVKSKGRVKITGKGLKSLAKSGGPGKITVALKLTSAGNRTLKKKHVLKVKAKVVF